MAMAYYLITSNSNGQFLYGRSKDIVKQQMRLSVCMSGSRAVAERCQIDP